MHTHDMCGNKGWLFAFVHIMIHPQARFMHAHKRNGAPDFGISLCPPAYSRTHLGTTSRLCVKRHDTSMNELNSCGEMGVGVGAAVHRERSVQITNVKCRRTVAGVASCKQREGDDGV